MRPKALMRVVGGKVKGRLLKGTISPGARPTTERVRAAIFNILDPDLYLGRKALDLYAGSGSLGIEALSQGAGWADFVERDRRQCQVIRENLENVGLSRQARIYCHDAVKSLAVLEGPYQLLLLDPPYRLQDLGEVIDKISSTPGLVDHQGIVVVGHSKHLELLPHYGSLELESHRRYGDNVVDFYARR